MKKTPMKELPLIKPDLILDSVKINNPQQRVNWTRLRASRPINPFWGQLFSVSVISFVIGFGIDTRYFRETMYSKNV